MQISLARVRLDSLPGNVQHLAGTVQCHAQGAAGRGIRHGGAQLSAPRRGPANHPSGRQSECKIISGKDKLPAVANAFPILQKMFLFCFLFPLSSSSSVAGLVRLAPLPQQRLESAAHVQRLPRRVI